MSHRFSIGDVITYPYQSGGYWRTVEAQILSVDSEGYSVEIRNVIEGPELLSNGSSLIGQRRAPRKDWIESHASLSTSVRDSSKQTEQDIEEPTHEYHTSARNVDELFEITGLDPLQWDCERFSVSSLPNGGFQSWARLVPSQTGSLNDEEWKDDFLQRIQVSTPYKYTSHSPTHHSDLLTEINLSDAHLRMLSWNKETNVDYDLDIACENLERCGTELLQEAGGFDLSKVVFVLGNDLFHTNTNEPFTKQNKNLLDTDSRYQKAFDRAIWLIRTLVDLALNMEVQVDIQMVQGNHDEDISTFFGKVLEAYYHGDDRVYANTSPKSRVYYRWGKNIIGLDHGDKLKWKEAPRIMAQDNPDISWESHPYREWHFGHLHHESSRDMNGTILRWAPAITQPDKYHHDLGYVGNRRGAQAFVYHKEKGLKYIIQENL